MRPSAAGDGFHLSMELFDGVRTTCERNMCAARVQQVRTGKVSGDGVLRAVGLGRPGPVPRRGIDGPRTRHGGTGAPPPRRKCILLSAAGHAQRVPPEGP